MTEMTLVECEFCQRWKSVDEFASEGDTICALCHSLMWTELRNEKRQHMPVALIDGWDSEDMKIFNQDLIKHTCLECGGRMFPAYRTALRRPLITCRCERCDFYGLAIVDDNKRIRGFYREFYVDASGGFLAEGDIPF